MTIESDIYLATMSNVAATVTVVTTLEGDGSPTGLTVSAFSSVSLDPPLVLVCIGNESNSLPALLAAGGFTVNFLSEGAGSVAMAMASKSADKFYEVPWRPAQHPNSGPVLYEDVFAYFECETTESILAGDHTILIGEVTGGAYFDDHPPLVWHRRGFADLTITED